MTVKRDMYDPTWRTSSSQYLPGQDARQRHNTSKKRGKRSRDLQHGCVAWGSLKYLFHVVRHKSRWSGRSLHGRGPFRIMVYHCIRQLAQLPQSTREFRGLRWGSATSPFGKELVIRGGVKTQPSDTGKNRVPTVQEEAAYATMRVTCYRAAVSASVRLLCHIVEGSRLHLGLRMSARRTRILAHESWEGYTFEGGWIRPPICLNKGHEGVDRPANF